MRLIPGARPTAVIALAAVLGVAGGSAALAASGPAEGTGQAEQAFADRVTLLRARIAEAPYRDEREPCGRALDQADRALRGHLLLAALGFIRTCWSIAEPRQHIATEVEATRGRDAFEAWWTRTRAVLDRRRGAVDADALKRAPQAIEAMAQAELVTVESYYTAGRLYGIETTLEAGVYYVGRALAAIEFAAWLGTLRFDRMEAAAPPVPPMTAALARLDTSILEAYRQATTADARRAFIAVNTTFKLATDLETAQLYAGALLELLRSTQALGIARRSGVGPPPPDVLRARLADASAAMAPGDHSIASLFVERAQLALGADAGPEPSADDRLLALAIIEDVLPAYRLATSGGRP